LDYLLFAFFAVLDHTLFIGRKAGGNIKDLKKSCIRALSGEMWKNKHGCSI